MANDSVSIAITEAIRQLDALGRQALYTSDEIEKIIRASFVALRATGENKEVLEKGILTLIERAAQRAKDLGADYEI